MREGGRFYDLEFPYIKIKNFCTTKDSINKKGKPYTWNAFGRDKGLVFRAFRA